MIKTLLCIVLAFALPLSAAEVTGTWVGSLEITTPDGQTLRDRCHMKLEQKGASVTGAVGPDRSAQWEIVNGKVEGSRITFDVRPPEGGSLQFDLRLAGDHLKGEARGENLGLRILAKVDVTRATD